MEAEDEEEEWSVMELEMELDVDIGIWGRIRRGFYGAHGGWRQRWKWVMVMMRWVFAGDRDVVVMGWRVAMRL